MVFKRNIFLFLLQAHLVLLPGQAIPDSLETDKAALLAFKRTVLSDPNSTLANWNQTTDVCNFWGVQCNKRRHRVEKLRLPGTELVGLLSPSIFNLTHLRVLILSDNFLFGRIPPELSSLRHLHILQLDGNNLHGPIPDSFSLFSNLFLVHLMGNNLTGTIPPSFFFNCTSLTKLDLSSNFLNGKIPAEIGNCPNISKLNLYNNQLTGEIPVSLTNASSSMYNLNVKYNCLSGELPSRIIAKLPVLGILQLSYNNMISHDRNTNLDSFFTALTNCTYLEGLELAGLQLGGRLPNSIGQIPHLHLLDLSNNRFSGEIPQSLGNLVRINSLFLNNNLLSGEIPPNLWKCTDLYKLDFSYNRLTGIIPPEISSMRVIRIFLNLSHNCLEGPLPIELSKMENVREIDLSSNHLSGSIYVQISSCIALRMINFSFNSIHGQLPESLGDLKYLEAFDVSRNNLSGMIPKSLSKIHSLTFLNLSSNKLVGMIPSGGIFDSVTNLSFLDNPRLCGLVPGIPICHEKHHHFHSGVILIVLCIVIFVSVLLSTFCVIGYCHLKGAETERKSTPEILNFPRITYKELSEATGGFDDQRLIGSGSYGRVYKGVLPDGTPIAVKVLQIRSFIRECKVLKRIRHRNLTRIITVCSSRNFKALILPYMENGSLDSCLYPHSGTGLGSGSSDLSLIQRVNICSDIAEGMAYLHHYSPVRVIHCDLKPSNVLLNDDMTALVSDFGIARLVITAGMGSSRLSEKMGNSTAHLVYGSIGYIAPEYGFGSSRSTKGDVYSFGILVLEMVTRKRPTDDMFVGDLTLHKWVKSHYHGQMEKIVDSSLDREMRGQSPQVKKKWAVAIVELTELGILCSQESPSTRPTMLDAADDLDRLKRYLRHETTTTFASSLGISSSTLGHDIKYL